MRNLGTLKAALVLAVFFVAACASGDDAAMRQAKLQCQAVVSMPPVQPTKPVCFKYRRLSI